MRDEHNDYETESVGGVELFTVTRPKPQITNHKP
jgi:hypothetical protein